MNDYKVKLLGHSGMRFCVVLTARTAAAAEFDAERGIREKYNLRKGWCLRAEVDAL